tara:strand:+ start:35 stop:883 length:849 start_codon:yes stop_codon:yes gene_type:complete
MNIEFKKSNIKNINKYVNLYRRCFKNYPHYKNEKYLEWLYNDNPVGNFIGIDAIDNGLEIGQVGGIPYEFNYNGNKIKILQSINVCVDQKYRGKKLFSEMATRLENYARDENYSFIIAIANKLATPAWLNSISMKFLSQLDVLIGYGDLGIKDLVLQENDFYSLWNQARITWRKNNPYNKVSINNEKKIKFISPSILSFIQVFSYLPNDNTSIVFDKKKFNFFLPHLFIGLIPKKNNKNLFFKVPNFLKPSPLNFLYKDISGKNSIIDVKKCFFSYLDFDAY